MKITFKAFFSFTLLLFAVFQIQAQARLTVENKSPRSMTVKVMKGIGKGTLHKTVTLQNV